MLKNNLSKSSNPYLLQHKDNPVQWQEWSDEILNYAKKNNKLLLISIGYSSCHWCHVMAHESFEDEGVAELMNEHFINIKIDREERPDIDQIYMEAAQLLTGRGGWPLNAFALPDGKPFYAGTYFPKENWIKVLENIATLYKDQPQTIIDTAERLTNGINNQDVFDFKGSKDLLKSEQELIQAYKSWYRSIDFKDGGIDKAPKFPMPVVWQSLLDYYVLYKDKKALEAVTTTLDKMLAGGIYDWVGGGFARYSVDGYWFAPHFEKMLYDNAQLIALYADAYKVTKNANYKRCVEQSIQFLNSELKHKDFGYYSALDADSEGVEGLFYCWKYDELKAILNDTELKIATSFFNLKPNGNWEDKLNILAQVMSVAQLAEEFKLTETEINSNLDSIKSKLKEKRALKVRPGLDDKMITAHNGMMIKALAKAFQATQESVYQKMALALADNLVEHVLDEDYSLKRIYHNDSVKGFLDDYAFVIEGFIYAYQISFEFDYLDKAKNLVDYTRDHFYDKQNHLFYYTPHSNKLIARKMEYSDNVIPSSNGIMAKNLWELGHLVSNQEYIDISTALLNKVKPLFKEFKLYFALWHQLELAMQKGQIEVSVTGPKALKNALDLQKHYSPFTTFCGGTIENLPQLKGKINTEKNQLFICRNQTCSAPFSNSTEASQALKSIFL